MRYSDYPPLWGDGTDGRLDLLELQLRKELGVEEDFTLLAMIQPATYINHNGIEVPIREVAILAVLTENPTAPGMGLMTQGAAWLDQFREAEREKLTYVGKEDPALPIFRVLLREHMRRLRDMRELIPVKRTVPSGFKIPVS